MDRKPGQMANDYRKAAMMGTWAKTDRKVYQRESGEVVSYDCNSWRWVVNGNSQDNHPTLAFAMWSVDRHHQ